MAKRPSSKGTSSVRVISMRLIVTAAAVVLITTAVITVAWVAERNVRKTLTRELETRLVLEARNLALLSSSALLSDFPELTLHPVVKEMQSSRPELKLVFVVDHQGNVQGHADVALLGTAYSLDPSFGPVAPAAALGDGESLVGNDELLVVTRTVLHPNGETIGSVYVGIGRRHAEASLMAARKQQLFALLPILVAAVVATMILMSRLLQPIAVLRGGLERIGKGQLDARVELKSHTELDLLANSINDMAEALASAQEERIEKERLAYEMELASEIQRSLLPDKPSRAGEFVVAGAQDAAAEVGGDYYDVFALDDGRIGIVEADVAGKGLAGCLVTSMIAVLIRTMRPYFDSPARLLVRLEEALANSLRPGTFITMFYGILDPKTGELVFASAAHNPLLIYRAENGSTEWHKTTGIPVGMAAGGALASSLKDDTVRLARGDVAFVFTDGLNEAVNASFEEFGFDRLSDTVRSTAPKGGSSVIEKIRSAVTEWEGGRPAEDDKTILAIERIARESAAFGTGGGGATDEKNGRRLRRLWEMRDNGRRISLPAQLDALDDVHDWMQQCEHLENLSRTNKILVEHGIYEILSNIAEHGCQLDGNKTIDVWWIVEESACQIDGYFLIRDHGLPPHPEEWPWAEPETPPDLRTGRGYGLRIIRKSLSEVEFHADTGKGNLTLVHCPIPARSSASGDRSPANPPTESAIPEQ